MNPKPRRSTRRFLVAGCTSLLAGAALPSTAGTSALQSDRRLLDLLVALEEIQIARYQALLAAFGREDFIADGFPPAARSAIENILAAEEAHLAVVARSANVPAPSPPAPATKSIHESLRELVEIENQAVGAYALVISELGKRGRIPELLGIHGVESRHAAWLASLLGDNPFPMAIDASLTLEDVVAGIAALESAFAGSGTPVVDEAGPILAAIARELGVSEDEVTLIALAPEVWPDASLGCPEPDMVYTEVLTPGFVVEVDVNGARHEFHADEEGNVVSCP